MVFPAFWIDDYTVLDLKGFTVNGLAQPKLFSIFSAIFNKVRS